MKFFTLSLTILSLLFTTITVAQKKALIIDDAVYTKSDTTINAAKLYNIQKMSVVEILTVSTNKKSLTGEYCDEAPWIKIKTSANQIGWIHGSQVYKIVTSNPLIEKVASKKFKIENEMWKIGLLRNFTTETYLEEEGVTGCDDRYPVLLYTDGFHKTQVIELIKEIRPNHLKRKYYSLEDSEGMSEFINGITSKEQSITIKITTDYQEERKTYDVTISSKQGKLIGQISNYKNLPAQ